MDFESKYNELVEAVRAVVENNPGLCNIDERLSRLSKLLPEKESNDEKIRKAICAAICGTTAISILEANETNLSDALSYLEKQKDLTKEGIIKQLEEEFYACGTTPKWFHDTVQGAINHGMAEALGEIKAHEPVSTIELKEQKPNIELIQKSWYLEGYHDGKYNNEPKWLIQTGKGGPMYEENPKYGTQQPAEWSEEDEDMYARIVRRYTDYEGVIMRTKEESVAAKMLDAMAQEENWLHKSLHPQSHWKPSEKQMEALRVAAYEPYKNWDKLLQELYNDLQKLFSL